MAISIRLPNELQSYAANGKAIPVQAETLGEAMQKLKNACPDLSTRLFDASGRLYSHLKLVYGQQTMNVETDAETTLADGDEIEIVGIASGG